MSNLGEAGFIKKVGGKPETRQFLEKLGFVPGSRVELVTKTGGNVIVRVKDSRIAISREMAARIMI
jgi:ferrous iron transport protein A